AGGAGRSSGERAGRRVGAPAVPGSKGLGAAPRRAAPRAGGQRHRPAARGDGLDEPLPVVARAEQPVETQNRQPATGLDPAELRHDARLAHAVLLPAGALVWSRRRWSASSRTALVPT